MYEDIILPVPEKQPTEKPRKPRKPRKPKLRISLISEPTAFEIVKGVDDIRMLGKILDLCRSKIRKKKRSARRHRKYQKK